MFDVASQACSFSWFSAKRIQITPATPQQALLCGKHVAIDGTAIKTQSRVPPLFTFTSTATLLTLFRETMTVSVPNEHYCHGYCSYVDKKPWLTLSSSVQVIFLVLFKMHCYRTDV